MDKKATFNFQEINRILKSLGSTPERKIPDQTYLEIAGYPSLENVASNILGFFLDPGEVHGFGTLFLESLLTTLNVDYSIDEFVDVEVEREVYTDQKCRIDIVVSTNSKTIGIENKLYANLTNDLNHYISHLSKGETTKQILGVLLTLSPIKIPESTKGFTNITYDQYFDVILSNTGKKLLDANNRYFSLFIEFVKTINNLGRENQMSNPEFIQWLTENEQEGNRLLQEITRLKKELTTKAKKIGSMINLEKYEELKIKNIQWIWDAFHYGEKIIAMDLVHDIKIENLDVAIDTMIRPSGFTMEIYERKGKTLEFGKFLSKKSITVDTQNDGTVTYGKKFPYQTDLMVVTSQLQELLDKIIT